MGHICQTDGTCYYVKDGQGNIVRIVGTYGQTIAEYAYDAYGNILSAPTSGVGSRNPYRYRGYYYDTETGFYYLQSRYYDPEVSRFINADEQFDENAGFVGTNLFAYCANNPVMFVDSSGRYIESQWNPLYSSFKVGLYGNVGRNGCGIVAVYNVLYSYRYCINFRTVCDTLSRQNLYNTVGLGGITPGSIINIYIQNSELSM